MALEFVGMKGNSAHVFKPDELGGWIVGKARRYIEPKNAQKCAEYMQGHSGRGGGGTKHKLDGQYTVFHISRGRKNKDDGCTCFFTTRDWKHLVIVGIGWHKTDTSYRLDYKRGSWNSEGKMLVPL